jgi:hypothetical protein
MEQVKFPIKIKIAAWWMIVIGGTFSIIPVLFIGYVAIKGAFDLRLVLIPFILTCFFPLLGIIFYLNPGLSLLKSKKGAWKSAVTRLSVLVIPFIILFCLYFFLTFLLALAFSPGHSLSSNWGIMTVGFFLIPSVIFFTPLALLLLDRKNSSRITS